MLEEVGLRNDQDMAVLEYACDVTMMPYNRRTSRPLVAIVAYVKMLKEADGIKDYKFPMRKAFKWWWAFCKKFSVISLYYKERSQNANIGIFEAEEKEEDEANTVVDIEAVNDPPSRDLCLYERNPPQPPPAHAAASSSMLSMMSTLMLPHYHPAAAMVPFFVTPPHHQASFYPASPQNLSMDATSRTSPTSPSVSTASPASA